MCIRDSDVTAWIGSLNAQFSGYAQALDAAALDGEGLLALSAEDLEELGVANRFHRGRISREIRRLREKLLTECDRDGV